MLHLGNWALEPSLKLFCEEIKKIPPFNECLFRLLPLSFSLFRFLFLPYLPAPLSPPGQLPCWCGEGK
nr:hypothetical protein Q903MT_gene1401 [Picea sitchensis]